ncbi:hypothetical protein BDP27DRAFT_1503981 [Rhodocollybia butyracea]|uniref:Uncharacterized protein n=1 Tax=Rhodocollybia butyracea TaxID=206335 RepID=A0A9P5P9S4_9AGAR|nr:hypothetical protein BDP27DRAFT_1503981 [Rhodocollybia butyracea]
MFKTQDKNHYHFRSLQFENAILNWKEYKNSYEADSSLAWHYFDFLEVIDNCPEGTVAPKLPDDFFNNLYNMPGYVLRLFPSKVLVEAITESPGLLKYYGMSRPFPVVIQEEHTMDSDTWLIFLWTGQYKVHRNRFYAKQDLSSVIMFLNMNFTEGLDDKECDAENNGNQFLRTGMKKIYLRFCGGTEGLGMYGSGGKQ